ncbi:MAG: type II toxin-antitoxin system HicA family toxin [Planctomycetaceae bacterium]|nr:type II toxin-antitoxin system HicA family toxin [Planctomycetaceae bacterium]
MKKKRLVAYLKTHGCYLVRQGEHEYWASADGKHGTAVPRHVEIKTETARSICRKLQIPKPRE